MRVLWVALCLWPALGLCAAEFNRDIRPVLSDRCFTCHGPDEAKRMSPLRLDTEAGIRGVVEPGDPAASKLYQRVSSNNPAVRMPPSYMGHEPLSEQDVGLIRDWIADGAEWQGHWAFVPPKRSHVPEGENPIDHFVKRRHAREGLTLSPEADGATLLRRVTLDLTGLPPTLTEIHTFSNDRSPAAYERVVDRLLASPRYGERMAFPWLEAARYADTNGYQTDAGRDMWRWRDWVIDAFNRNMPFDQFTIEQIAGDLLPNPALDQMIATGFNRNHRGNGEGGIVADEYAVEYVVDRVETTSTVWLGLTMGCARCHDHKYDPITQHEFYRMFAYFNNVPERGRYFKYGNTPPVVKAPTAEQRDQLASLDAKIANAEVVFAQMQDDVEAALDQWAVAIAASEIDWAPEDDLVVDAAEEQEFDGSRHVDAGDLAKFGFHDRFTLAAWVYPTSADGAILGRTKDSPEGTRGYAVHLKDGKVQAHFVVRWLDDAMRVETQRALELDRWHHVAVSYDGSLMPEGVRIYVDGKRQSLNVLLDELNQSFSVNAPLWIGGVDGDAPRFQGRISGVRVYERELSPELVEVLATRETVSQIAAVSGRSEKLRLCFLEKYAPEPIRQAWHRLGDLRAKRAKLWDNVPTVMVMREREQRRDTFVLERGIYNQPGEKVEPGIPAVFDGSPDDRLAFARWLVCPENPLTARVIVNRFWQMLFGTGLVKTAENFGSQGSWPSHPDLLDWLAVEFMENGWDTKALLKTIVMSGTYRQSSKASKELLERDPENRLLARGPRIRLSPEMVRDQALAVSGLLVERIGGPSVKPYQPPGLWSELAGSKDYERDSGENLYRRSLYTFWKRTAPPPGMMTFDAAGRETCRVLDTRTNTPLQALNLMNDVTYVEASRKLAERMMTEGGATPAERIGFAYRLFTARPPAEEERKVLLSSFRHFLNAYGKEPTAARELLEQGESPRTNSLDAKELAAYTMVASLVLNLDAAVTKE